MSIYKKLEHTVPQPSLKPGEAKEEPTAAWAWAAQIFLVLPLVILIV